MKKLNKVLILTGSPAAGESFLTNILRDTLHNEECVHIDGQTKESRKHNFWLRGITEKTRYVIFDDVTDENTLRQIVCNLVGNGTIVICDRCNELREVSVSKLQVIITTKIPLDQIINIDQAFFRRINIIDIKGSFLGSAEIKSEANDECQVSEVETKLKDPRLTGPDGLFSRPSTAGFINPFDVGWKELMKEIEMKCNCPACKAKRSSLEEGINKLGKDAESNSRLISEFSRMIIEGISLAKQAEMRSKQCNCALCKMKRAVDKITTAQSTEKSKPKFADAMIGDKVYHLQLGPGVIIGTKHRGHRLELIAVKFPKIKPPAREFSIDGKENQFDLVPSLYHSKPTITEN